MRNFNYLVETIILVRIVNRSFKNVKILLIIVWKKMFFKNVYSSKYFDYE